MRPLQSIRSRWNVLAFHLGKDYFEFYLEKFLHKLISHVTRYPRELDLVEEMNLRVLICVCYGCYEGCNWLPAVRWMGSL